MNDKVSEHFTMKASDGYSINLFLMYVDENIMVDADQEHALHKYNIDTIKQYKGSLQLLQPHPDSLLKD